MVLPLADCVALGTLFDLSGFQTKQQEKKYKKKDIFCISGEFMRSLLPSRCGALVSPQLEVKVLKALPSLVLPV